MNPKTPFLKTLITFFILTASFWLLAQPVLAKVIRRDQSAVIAQDEVVDEDLFIGSGMVSINGTVNGNLFVAGGQINLTGTVKGSVFAVGGSLTTNNATIQGNLVAGAGNINVTATKIGQGIIAGAGNLIVDGQSLVNGGVVAGAGHLSLEAPIGKGVLAAAGSVTLNSQIQKDVRLSVEQLALGKNADLKGSLTYTSSQDASVHKSAQIAGKVTKETPAALKKSKTTGVAGLAKRVSLGFKFFSYLSSLLLGLIILYLFPKDSQKITKNLLEKPWRSLGIGFLVLVLTIPAALLLMFGLIGIPLALLSLITWGIAIYLTKIFVGLLFGRSLLEALGKTSGNLYLSLVIGLAVYQVLTLVPLLGWFVTLATITFGLGALFMCGRDYVQQNKNSSAL